jgi:hypothetical protein
MIVIQLLQAYASQLSLLKVSLMTQIQRPWQSVRNTRIRISGKNQLKLSLTHLRKERCSLKRCLHLSEPFLLGSSEVLFIRETKIMRW